MECTFLGVSWEQRCVESCEVVAPCDSRHHEQRVVTYAVSVLVRLCSVLWAGKGVFVGEHPKHTRRSSVGGLPHAWILPVSTRGAQHAHPPPITIFQATPGGNYVDTEQDRWLVSVVCLRKL